ncbi:MAG: hypothetical protein KBS52_02075, partial [Clostridiales bacterium]|nr:hypothetical protein [Candidatus Equinaster intestinalis]
MFNDEDYGFLTGGLGDLDGDGDVDFGEYLNEEDDFERIMGTHDDYNSFSDDAYEDDDWKDIYTDTADKLGLDLDDYSDEDEFLEAVEEANEDTDDDSDSGYESTEQSGSFYPSHTCQTYMKNNVIDESIESRYRVPHGEYRIGDAIFDRFSEVRNNFTKNECDCIMDVIPKIYSVNKTLGLRILLWIIDNFPHALTSDYIAAVVPQSSQICSHIIFNFREIDEDSDKDIVFKYLSGKPELEVLIFEETYFNDIPISLLEYIKYCINNNLLKSFERVYFGFVKNKLVADYIKD